MQPAQATKGQRLVNEVARLTDRDPEEIQFDLKRHRRDANALMLNDPGAASYALGLICTFENDYQGMLSNFEKALRYLPNEPSLLFNFGGSLAHFFQYSEAADYIIRSIEISNLTEKDLTLLVNWLSFSGRFSEAVEYFELSKKLLGVPSGVFFLCAVISLFSFFFVLKLLPETKGRSLEV